jgi:hypothetical protein
MTRPRIDPSVVASFAEAAPKRVARKLDKDPGMADGWTWDEDDGTWQVTTDREETVTLHTTDGCVHEAEAIACTCLLAPRCLHVLAVITRLDLATEPAAPSADQALEETAEAPADEALSTEQRDAVRSLWNAAAEVLERGARTAGAVPQAHILRATHACRLQGLYRIAQSGLRLVERIREFRNDGETPPVVALTTDLLDILGTARALSRGRASEHAVGVARRRYTSAGSLALHGVATERIVSADGYAGVVTHFVDADGRAFSVADVRGGPASRAGGAYDGAIGMGATLAHRKAGRSRVLIQGATASAEGRLGSGAKVRAVEGGPSRWNDAVVGAMFDRSIRAQVEPQWTAADPLGPAPDVLLFVTAQILGADDDALWMEIRGAEDPPRTVRATIAGKPDNLRVLAQATGLVARVVGRVDPRRPHTFALIACGPAPEHEDALVFPETWGATCNLGLDSLPRSAVRDLHANAPRFEAAPEPDPFLALRRRLHALAVGGRAALSPSAAPTVAREAAQLRRRLCASGADALERVSAAALDVGRAIDGRRLHADADTLAEAWLAACLWERTAREALIRDGWV